MNQLEHLKALRDKARIQTEQAKAVLKQQGEISDSLDRLIEALEGNGDPTAASNAVLSATDANHVGSQTVPVPSQIPEHDEDGNLIGKVAAGVGAAGVAAAGAGIVANLGGKDEVVWETQALPEVEPITSPNKKQKLSPPRLEPIVWEVASGDAASSIATEPFADSDDEDGPGSKFRFLKLGGSEDEGDDVAEDETRGGIAPVVGVAAAGGVAAIAAGAASLLKGDDNNNHEAGYVDIEETEDTIAIPAVGVAAVPPPLSVPAPPPVIAPVTVPANNYKVNSNIFFDANSAYLKDSELSKLKVIADSLDASGSRIVKIQGLEDLASSNDFKELLASRRMLAVKKKLAEGGVKDDQITLSEINLSEEGRILSPPSLAVSA